MSKTGYFRFNPVLGRPDEFPIDVTDPEKLDRMKKVTREYMQEPEQLEKMDAVAGIVKGRPTWRKAFRRS